MTALLVFAGAGIGGVARYVIGGWIQSATGAAFPWGTLFVNVTGALLLLFLLGLLERTSAAPEWRLFLGIGVCGGYTTFSTFNYEVMRFLHDGEWWRAFAYAGASITLTVAAAFLGYWLASVILQRA